LVVDATVFPAYRRAVERRAAGRASTRQSTYANRQVQPVDLVDQVLPYPGMEVTVREAKAQLSRLLRRVEAGEEVVIRRGPKPIAVLVRVKDSRPERQIWGDLEGSVAEDFDEVPSEFDPRA
jgi:prevent-host-death family protein